VMSIIPKPGPDEVLVIADGRAIIISRPVVPYEISAPDLSRQRSRAGL
jgi:hypothetical protein